MFASKLRDGSELCKDSDFLKNVLPENILSTYIENKKIEYDKYVKARVKEQYERDLYFGSI